MRKISLLRQYEALAEMFLALRECPDCGNLRNKGYICPWAGEGCPGEP